MTNSTKITGKLAALILALLFLTGCGTAALPQSAAPAPVPAVEPADAPPAADEAVSAETDAPEEIPAVPDIPEEVPAKPEVPEEAPVGTASSELGTPDSSFGDSASVVKVSTVDELLSAIAPNTAVSLAAGVYDFSTASTYGRDTGSPYIRWEPVFDYDRNESYELIVSGVDNLTLRGAGLDSVTLAAIPRYANVLHFVGCSGLTLSQLTAGHTEEPGFCAGGVLLLEDCHDVDISFCGLFGCGTVGVDAVRCRDLAVRSSHIYDCSQYAVHADTGRSIRVTDCDVYGNGSDVDAAFSLFEADSCDGFLVADCRVRGNASQTVLSSKYSRNVRFLSNRVEENLVYAQVFSLDQYPAVVDACSFENISFAGGVPFTGWYWNGGLAPCDPEGNELSPYALKNMTWQRVDPALTEPEKTDALSPDVPVGGEVTVTTADEFLAAIGPDRTIILDTALLDLSTASDFGVLGGDYYFWRDWYDGPELVISGVQNLRIRSASDDPAACTVAAVPRYANVLAFIDCSGLELSGFTAGHTDGQGACTGGVLFFESCSDILVESCRLYGCGILGIEAMYCSDLSVSDCEIYDCSQGGVRLYLTDRASFAGCSIHDVMGAALSITECAGILWDSTELSDGWYDLEGTVPYSVSYN